MRSSVVGVGAFLMCAAGFAACGGSFGNGSPETPSGDADVVSDTASPDDAMVLADADAGTGSAAACNSVHAFCDDFDKLTPGTTPDWGDSPTVGANGSIGVRSFAAALSAPNVVESKVSNVSKAILSTTFAVGTNHGATCRFAYQIVTNQSPQNLASFAIMTLQGGKAHYTVDLRYDNVETTGTGADGGAAPSSFKPSTPPALGVWTPVVIAIQIGKGGSIEVDVAGKNVATLATDPAITAASTAHLDLGVQPYSSAGNDWQVLYDDVVCDFIP